MAKKLPENILISVRGYHKLFCGVMGFLSLRNIFKELILWPASLNCNYCTSMLHHFHLLVRNYQIYHQSEKSNS